MLIAIISSGGGGQPPSVPNRTGPSAVAAAVPSVLPAPSTPSPTTSPASPPPPRPVRLLIPALQVDAAVENVGVDAGGALGTPQNVWNVGWFSPGPAPGASGDAVVDGHLGLPGYPLVFSRLAKLHVGDLIKVVSADLTTRSFAVASVTSWPALSHPTGLFATAGPPRLSLITCGGEYSWSSQTYADRVVVEANLSAA